MLYVFNSNFASKKTRDRRVPHTTPTVSRILLAFVGLREAPESAAWMKAADRAETCEIPEDRLHEVETELKESREEKCWIFQVRCGWTCS